MTALRWLDFDYGEGTDDTGVFDALASVEPQHVAQVEAEIAAVIAWAEAQFMGPRGPIEEGGEWDCEVQRAPEPDTGRHVYSFTIGGSLAFCDAFRQRFESADF